MSSDYDTVEAWQLLLSRLVFNPAPGNQIDLIDIFAMCRKIDTAIPFVGTLSGKPAKWRLAAQDAIKEKLKLPADFKLEKTTRGRLVILGWEVLLPAAFAQAAVAAARASGCAACPATPSETPAVLPEPHKPTRDEKARELADYYYEREQCAAALAHRATAHCALKGRSCTWQACGACRGPVPSGQAGCKAGCRRPGREARGYGHRQQYLQAYHRRRPSR